jgi:hypothetical protein
MPVGTAITMLEGNASGIPFPSVTLMTAEPLGQALSERDD